MLFDIGPLELLTIIVIAIVVLGPDKLPKAISDAAALIRKFRAFSDSAQNEIRQELGPDFADLQLRDLHPRTLAHRALTGVESELGLQETQSLSPQETAAQGNSHSLPTTGRAQTHHNPQALVDLDRPSHEIGPEDAGSAAVPDEVIQHS
ncbi:Sec-independent protein translocase protein TatB [Streptomyces sp. NPDC059881]|uniref:Sec-independent protein translocase protein TatB n=1 Tax=Streptomyces sp. NPDC059881 TaxID=3346986 RepID=UPI00365031D1